MIKKDVKKQAICRTDLTGDEIIHVDCVDHTYPDGTMGLDGLCFSVHRGEVVALCGPNGSGKTTLLEHLVGLLTPKSGRIVILGNELKKSRYKEIRQIAGFIFQYSDDQLFAPTIIDDVMFGPRNLGFSKDVAFEKAKYALTSVFGRYPEELVNKMPQYLSGGEKKMVAIAGILAMEPKIIVADEITANLDPYHATLIENILLKLRADLNMSIVFATHNLDMALRLADRVCLIDKGSIIKEGTPREIFKDPIINELDLEIPQLIKIYNNLVKKVSNFKSEPIPRSVEELNNLINKIINN